MIRVISFVFDFDRRKVLLKPEWQSNKLSGVGGGVVNSDAIEMSKELWGETHLNITMWREFCILTELDSVTHFFTANFDSEVILPLLEAKRPRWVDYDNLPENVIDNLTWLIPMALAKVPVLAHVTETKDEVT